MNTEKDGKWDCMYLIVFFSVSKDWSHRLKKKENSFGDLILHCYVEDWENEFTGEM